MDGQTPPAKQTNKKKKTASQQSSTKSTPSKHASPRPPPPPSTLHRAFEQPTVYASGAHDPPPPPPLPSFVTDPQDSSRYYRVVGMKTQTAIPIAKGGAGKQVPVYGTSCPPQITTDPGQRLLGALKSQQQQVKQSKQPTSSDDLTLTVKRLLNIE